MPRYFLDLSNDIGFVPDQEGQIEASLHAAKAAAIEALRGLISDEIKQGKAVSRGSFISVRSEADGEVAKVYFYNAITIKD